MNKFLPIALIIPTVFGPSCANSPSNHEAQSMATSPEEVAKYWYAACNNSHSIGGAKWYGPHRSSRSQADSDVKSHKKSTGHKDAGVLGSLLSLSQSGSTDVFWINDGVLLANASIADAAEPIGRKTAVARVDSSGGSSMPSIVVTKGVVSISFAAGGGGNATGSKLVGTGGTYVFSRGGRYTVSKGTYDFKVSGTISGKGWIRSTVGYE
jgi:hypothetical protein